MKLFLIRAKQTPKAGVSGWVLIETLMSLVIFALVISVLNQQNEQEFDQLKVLKSSTKKEYRDQQLLTLRRLKQDYLWLEASLEVGGLSECETCSQASLDAWFLHWIAPVGTVEFLSSELILGVSE